MNALKKSELTGSKIKSSPPSPYIEKPMSLANTPSSRLLSPTTKHCRKKKVIFSRWWTWLNQQQETQASDSRATYTSHSPSIIHHAFNFTSSVMTIWVTNHAGMLAAATAAMSCRAVKDATATEYGLMMAHLAAWLWLIIHTIFHIILPSRHSNTTIIHHYQASSAKASAPPQDPGFPIALSPCWPPFKQSSLISDILVGIPSVGMFFTDNSKRRYPATAELWEHHEQSVEQYRQAFPICPTERRRHNKQQKLKQHLNDGEEASFGRENEQLVKLAKEALVYFENAYSLSPDNHRDNMINLLREVTV